VQGTGVAHTHARDGSIPSAATIDRCRLVAGHRYVVVHQPSPHRADARWLS
jgi:hypothetical protein